MIVIEDLLEVGYTVVELLTALRGGIPFGDLVLHTEIELIDLVERDGNGTAARCNVKRL